MPWTPDEVRKIVKPPLKLGLGSNTSISAAPHTGILDSVRNWIQGNAPESVLDAADNLKILGSILGLDSPMSAYAGGVAASANSIIPKIEPVKSGFASGLKKLGESSIVKWLGNSKLIKKGKPIPVYHGTDVDIVGNFKTPSFFTTDKELASNYGKNVGEYYIKVENPFYHPAELPGAREGYISKKEFADALKSEGVDVDKIFSGDSDYFDEGLYDVGELYENSDVIKAIKKEGYDSLYLPEEYKDTYSVFSPRQIKKVIR
jgi:hypothetical protein